MKKKEAGGNVPNGEEDRVVVVSRSKPNLLPIRFTALILEGGVYKVGVSE